MATRFYCETPKDKYGNCLYRLGEIDDRLPVVIEAELVDDGWSLKVVKPDGFQWPTVASHFWQECEGPARRITMKEWWEMTGQTPI